MFSNELINRRSEFSRIAFSESKPSNLTVLKTYFGTTDTSRTMKKIASIVVFPSEPVIEKIRNTMSNEQPGLNTGKTEFQNHEATTSMDSITWLDCRVFISLI